MYSKVLKIATLVCLLSGLSIKSIQCSEVPPDITFNLPDYDYSKASTRLIKLREASGIAVDFRNNYYFVHEDGNNPNEVKVYNKDINLINTIKLEGIHNYDWEDITTDRQGTFWIINSKRNIITFKTDQKANLIPDSEKIIKLPAEIKDKNIESIDYIPEKKSFIIITKGHGNKVYRTSKDFTEIEYITSIPEELKMKPSGVTHHPETGNFFVLTFWGAKVVEFTPDFKTVLNILPLKTKFFYGFQPEGIDFDRDYNLIIVAEKPWYLIKGKSSIITMPLKKVTQEKSP